MNWFSDITQTLVNAHVLSSNTQMSRPASHLPDKRSTFKELLAAVPKDFASCLNFVFSSDAGHLLTSIFSHWRKRTSAQTGISARRYRAGWKTDDLWRVPTQKDAIALGTRGRHWSSSDQNWGKLSCVDYTHMGPVEFPSLTAHTGQKNLPGVPFMLYSRRLRPAASFAPEDRKRCHCSGFEGNLLISGRVHSQRPSNLTTETKSYGDSG